MPPPSISSWAATMCSGSSSLIRSRSVRSGLGCKGGHDPQRYRAQSSRGTSQFSTAQHSTAFGTVHQDRYTQRVPLARRAARPLARPVA
eukprot:8047981-Pyramimonas_sp.AAC.1